MELAIGITGTMNYLLDITIGILVKFMQDTKEVSLDQMEWK